MNARRASSALLVASATLLAIAAVRWQGTMTTSLSAATRTPSRSEPSAPRATSDSLPELVDFLVTNDPFRLSNTPPTVRFDLGSDAQPAGIAPPPAPRPVLVLKAIVGGPPWQALIDGIPGQPPGAIAEQGQRFGRFLVKVVSSDSVVVQGPDTSWVLGFRKRS